MKSTLEEILSEFKVLIVSEVRIHGKDIPIFSPLYSEEYWERLSATQSKEDISGLDQKEIYLLP